MESKFQIFLILLAVLAGTAVLARRLNAAPAILLLIAGIALAFVPGMPASCHRNWCCWWCCRLRSIRPASR
jgi:hypothetical protein